MLMVLQSPLLNTQSAIHHPVLAMPWPDIVSMTGIQHLSDVDLKFWPQYKISFANASSAEYLVIGYLREVTTSFQ